MGLNTKFEKADAATGAALTDNSGGVVSTTIAAITGDASVVNAIATLTDQINKAAASIASLTKAINAGEV